ncbi:ribosomal protein S18-alanine N-acetyltransferase [Clostridium gasigenes]|uniref:[Ribosomal protein bS18]-alanine N-acetyltransferase n=1 Tax=Clostridium gasigenes TaxID=94869 RepID=A0A7X0SAX6_9CLOT|nr:ribosomal protein S18-alanine N-acetyltransferase [Clostridium gasigenes]MBB6714234.1 ribosomal protein S18-alanine N-acetyltransferase [Clostridium gasigenes]
MKITYNLMNTSDIDGVFEISKICFSLPWSKASVESELSNPLAKYIVAKDIETGRVVGFIGVWIITDIGDITNIGVHPDYRRNNIASELLNSVLTLCIDLDCTIFNLEVRRSNLIAQNLYKKLGFKETGLRKNYYGNSEDAILMQKYDF